eukprot:770781-Prymnesium_polylepis.1
MRATSAPASSSPSSSASGVRSARTISLLQLSQQTATAPSQGQGQVTPATVSEQFGAHTCSKRDVPYTRGHKENTFATSKRRCARGVCSVTLVSLLRCVSLRG